MNRTSKLAMALTALFFTTTLFTALDPVPVEAFTARTLVHGSRGYDVDELQGRLQFLGYYHGKIDGIYGWQTRWAVTRFQRAFGMKADGVVGTHTKTALTKATQGWTPGHPTSSVGSSSPPQGGSSGSHVSSGSPATSSPHPATTGIQTQLAGGHQVRNLSAHDIQILAQTVYGEARGEPFIGQVAVAAVILNRMESPLFPHTVPAIVYQPGAFTAVSDGQINLQPDPSAFKAVMTALHGVDPSSGALYYFNPSTATSRWIWSRPQIKTIGHHIFTR